MSKRRWHLGQGVMRLFYAYSLLLGAILTAWRTPRILALILICLLIALVQAFVFTFLEDWRFVDAFYFSVVSMATVGYGDFAPTTTLSKLCALVFLMIGIGVFVLTVGSIAQVILRELAHAEDLELFDRDNNRAPPRDGNDLEK